MTTTEPITVDVLDAAAILTTETRQNGLTVHTFEIHPGRQGVDEPRRQVPAQLTEIRLHLFGKPDLFLRWIEHLQVEQVHVHRRAFDTCLHASAVLHGLRWRINGDVSRPYDSGRYLPHLPGIIVDWAKQPSGRRGDDAYITLPELRTTVAALGIAGGVQ